MRPKKRKLLELLYTDMAKSGTIRITGYERMLEKKLKLGKIFLTILLKMVRGRQYAFCSKLVFAYVQRT